MTFLDRLNSPKFAFTQNRNGGKMIKYQQSQALTSHLESFWSIVQCLLAIQKSYSAKLIVFCCLVIHSYPTYLNLVACRDVKTFQMLFSVSQLSPHLSLLTVWKVPTPQNCIFVHSIFRIRGCRKKGKLRGHFSSGNVFPFVKKKGVRETKLLLIVSGLSGLNC